jgi:hypothetical protein
LTLVTFYRGQREVYIIIDKVCPDNNTRCGNFEKKSNDSESTKKIQSIIAMHPC